MVVREGGPACMPVLVALDREGYPVHPLEDGAVYAVRFTRRGTSKRSVAGRPDAPLSYGPSSPTSHSRSECNNEPEDVESAQTERPPAVAVIGRIESVHAPRRGAPPRQGSVCPSSFARLRVDWGAPLSLDGISEYSHVWLLFLFSQNKAPATSPIAHPPRLRGASVGLFASRAPVRPSPLGMTLASLERVERNVLHLGGVDLVDGTPVLDIKPYIPEYDAPRGPVRIASWISAMADDSLKVELAPEFEEQFMALAPSMRLLRHDPARALAAVREAIACDPRKGTHRPSAKGAGAETYRFVFDGVQVTCRFPPGERRAIAVSACAAGD